MSPLSRPVLRRLAAATTLTLAAGLSAGAFASPHGGYGMTPLRGHGIERMLASVDASAEQRAQIEQITLAARAEAKGQVEARRALHEQMRALFAQPTVDANALEALRQQMLAQHDRDSQRRMQTMLEISRVLTPEQRQQLAERMQQRTERMKRRHGDRQPRAGADGKTS